METRHYDMSHYRGDWQCAVDIVAYTPHRLSHIIITGFQLENNILNTLVQSNNLDNPCLTPVSQEVITVKDK